MYEGYLQMGCTEILNASRAYWYSHTADCPVDWLKLTYCDNLADALNGQVPYDIADVATAPWYDERDPATARFYGAYPVSITGLTDSTRTATITEGILDGGSVSGYRNAVRKVDVRAILLARGQDALESGLSWLDAALRPDECGIHGNTCGESDLEFFNSCPPRHGSSPGFSPWETTATNLATNPSFETISGTVEVYRNLATNPSFETASGTVTVRTNLASNPIPSSPGWLSNNQTVYAHSFDATGGRRNGPVLKVTRAATTPSNLLASMYAVGTTAWNVATRVPVTPGQVISFSVYAKTDVAGVNGTVTGYFFDAANAAVGGALIGPAVAITGGWTRVTHTVTVPAGATNFGVGAGAALASGNSVGGEIVYFTDAQIELSDAARPYFDGGVVPWLRENLCTNPHPSVSGTLGGGTASGASSVGPDGAQTIPSATTTPYVWSAKAQGGAQIGKTYAFRCRLTMETLGAHPITGVNVRPHKRTPNTYYTGPVIPWTPGTQIVSFIWVATETILDSETFDLSAVGGGSAPAGSLRLAMDEVVIEEVPAGTTVAQIGAYFDGAVKPSTDTSLSVAWTGTAHASSSYIYDPDLTAAWSGTANASNSTLSAPGLAGQPSASQSCLGIQSTRYAASGTKAIRIIPTGTGNNSTRYNTLANFGLTTGKTYTAMATLHLKAPQTGTLNSRARTLSLNAGGIQDQAPNVAGSYPLRITFTIDGTTITTATTLSLYNGAAEGGGDVWFDNLLIVEGTYTGAYFDGATPLADPDFTTAWTGTAHASETTVTGPGTVVPLAGAGWSSDTNGGRAVASTLWSSTGTRSMRIIATVSNAAYRYLNLGSGGGLVAGRTYTAIAKIRLPAPQTGILHDRARSLLYSLDGVAQTIATAPNQTGVHELRITFTHASSGTRLLMFYNGAEPGKGDVWFDDFLLIEGAYIGPYFDGSTPDTALDDYAWTGTPDASTSTHATRTEIQIPWTEEEYQARVDPYWRVLHGVTCISGPLVEQKLRRDAEGGGIWAYVVKFTLAASTPFVFGLPASVPLPSVSPTVVSDTPVNLVPYPSVGLTSGVVEVARNYMRNPSAEADNTNWAVAYDGTSITTGAVIEVPSTQNPVSGAKSIKQVYTAPATSAVAGWFAAQQEAISLPTTAGVRFSFTVSATNSASAGTVLGDLEVHAIWRNGTTTLRDDTIGKIGTGVTTGTLSVKSLVPPATTNAVIVQVRQRVTSRTNGNVVNVWIDAVAVMVP